MAVREVVLLGAPILRERAREVEHFDDSLQELVRDMFHTMAFEEGAGLAAPQVGIGLRLFVADTSRSEGGVAGRVVLVNPRIVAFGDEEERESEGCLSVPGVSEVVARPARTVVEGFDASGAPVRIEAEGLLSRVIQHELDHLDGILFFDRITPLKRRMLLVKYRKLQEEETGK